MKSSLSPPRLGLPPPYLISRPSQPSRSTAFRHVSSVLLVVCTGIILLITYSRTRVSPIYRPIYTCPPLPEINTTELFRENHKRVGAELTGFLWQRQVPWIYWVDHLFLFPTGPRLHRLDADVEIDNWRTNANAMYIAGDLWVANAALALWYSPPPGGPISPDHEFYHVALILPELSQREEIFSGSYPSFETHLAERRIHEIWTPRNWSSRLPQFKHFHTTDISQISHLIDLEDHVVEEVPEFTERFYYARKSKGGEELKAIEYASRVASYAHRGIKETISQNIHISETTLAAQFKHHSAYCYTRLQAYPPVIALDRHTAVLHHRVGEDESNGYKGFFPDQPEPSPQTLLVDAAPEYMGYASSLTRTWLPRPGADTELIDMVKRIQAAVIRRVTPPIMSWLDVYPIATEVLVDELLEHGFFLEGVTSGDVITSQAWRIFMPHEIGHHVGLDLYDYGIAPKELHVHFGTAFTIGPGIYFIPSLWNETSTAGKLVNWPRVKEWAATGVVGVRHEDVVIMWHDESVTIPTREVV